MFFQWSSRFWTNCDNMSENCKGIDLDMFLLQIRIQCVASFAGIVFSWLD